MFDLPWLSSLEEYASKELLHNRTVANTNADAFAALYGDSQLQTMVEETPPSSGIQLLRTLSSPPPSLPPLLTLQLRIYLQLPALSADLMVGEECAKPE